MEKQSERIKHRRGFLPAVLVFLTLAVCWTIMFLFVPPDNILVTVLFLVVTFFSSTFLFALIFGKARRGLECGIGLILFLGLGYWGAGTWLNFLLILGILSTLEYYLAKR